MTEITERSLEMGLEKRNMKAKIQLSDHFTYGKLLRFTLPSIVMMVFTSIYSVVDGFFISNFAGKTAFAALNLIWPFLMILGGMGFMIGTGGTALVSRYLGAGQKERARRYFSMLVEFTALLGLILTAIGLIFMEPIARFLGATEEMIPDCVLYGRIVIAFNVAFMFQNVFQSFLVAAEKPRLGLAATVSAGVTNMVLDALMVGVFRWGLAGAALATGLSQTVGAVIPLVFFLNRENGSALHFSFTPMEAHPLLQACGNGASELMSNISGSIAAMVYNFQLLKFLGEDGVSAYGVIMYVGFIFVAIFVGYSIGSAPIISFHFGAENREELKNMFRKSYLLMAVWGIAMALAAYLLAGPLAKLFVGYDRQLCELTTHAMGLYCLAFLFTGANIFTSSLFTALNDGTVSAAVSFARSMVLQIATVLLLPGLMGPDGLWLAALATDTCALVMDICVLAGNRKKYGYC